MVIRWPGVIRPGTIKNEMFASLDWLPTLVEIAGGPKGDALKQRVEAGYPGLVKTTLDGVNQIDYLSGKSEKSARDHFLYYSGKDPSAVRYKNWKMYFAMVSDSPAGFIAGVQPYHWTQVVNIKRDPFETSVGTQIKTLFGMSIDDTVTKVETTEQTSGGMKRRDLLLSGSSLVAASAFSAVGLTSPAQAQQPAAAPAGQRPNILVIWGDDVGLANVSAYSFGLMGIKTPNIDRIAREGMMAAPPRRKANGDASIRA